MNLKFKVQQTNGPAARDKSNRPAVKIRRVGVLGLCVLLALSIFALNANAAREAWNVDITITPDKEEAYLVEETAMFDIEIKRRGRYARLKLEQIEATFHDEATHVTLIQIDRGRYTYTTPPFADEEDPTLDITIRTLRAVRSIQRLERVIEIFEKRIEHWQSIKERIRHKRLERLIDRIIAIYQRLIKRPQATIDRISTRGIIGHNSCTIDVVNPVKYIEQMEKGLTTGSWEDLTQAAATLKEMGKLAVPKLSEAFMDSTKNPILRKMYGEILAEIKDSSAAEPLIAVLNDLGQEESVRAEASYTLGDIGDEAALNPLLNALNDESEHVRSSAALGLGYLGSSDAVARLIEKLIDPGLNMRICTIRGLGLIGDSGALEPLVDLLDDECETIVCAAILALGAIEDDEAVDPLLNILQIGSTKKQIRAMGALGQIGDTKAVDPLITFLQGEDEYLVMESGLALAQIGDPRAVEPLEKAIEKVTDEFVRSELKKAYETLTGEEYQG